MSLRDHSLGLEDLKKAEKEAGEEEEEQEEEEEEGEEDDESADIRTTTSISAFSGSSTASQSHSDIWNYFKVTDKKAVCLYCQ